MGNQIQEMYARQLVERKRRLAEAVSAAGDASEYSRLLRDVDEALEKISNGTYGLCQVCNEPIETERLALDPLVKYCVDHLSEAEQHALERDLAMAREIQMGLLPKRGIPIQGWDSDYLYQPSGQVSGDYCDIITPRENRDSFYFIIGDVTGKGIAASLLMSQLHATFRSLAGTGLPLSALMEQANRVFCEASIATHFATLVCGVANRSGEVQLSNAGHCFPVLVREAGINKISSSGLPLGVTCDAKYGVERTKLDSGESLVLYTDGLTESAGLSGALYGEERLHELLSGKHGNRPQSLIKECVNDLNSFAGGRERHDDLTILVVRKD